ncbi:murein transglycosylase A [Roseateles amylovorans]|uniref:peptidoglycan lytic exotransglycosylase n=1 Tax=Roseateles amylovorans TaxID=2978473 RepID=A0ABY6B0F6_9BURK|nr:MltA domain-containing protein [Roseateles amylovorans]UXH78881.1 MltA domain-containing protein [Roseateles amylovorans]
MLAILGVLAGCGGPSVVREPGSARPAPTGTGTASGSTSKVDPARLLNGDWPGTDNRSSAAAAAPSPGSAPGASDDRRADTVGRQVLARERARWVAAEWNELPGWGQDRALEWWPALLRGCERPMPGWTALCTQAQRLRPSDDWDAYVWLMKRLRPYRVESPEGERDGLATGYYEPQLEARRQALGDFRVPLLAPPQDLAQRRPYDTRQQIESNTRLSRLSLAWVQDPLDALVMQIQGSGRLRVTESDGSSRWVRLSFAGHNEQPYRSMGQWLIAQGELKATEASWPGIKEWARRNPQKLKEAMWANPRYVFFREEPLSDPAVGPRGGQGVPLTPGRSIAVDKASIPYGTPVWLDTTEPLSTTPMRRLVMAQDTGAAITGAVRADFFWGWGDQAEQQAGRMKQPLRLWVLWPRETASASAATGSATTGLSAP